VLTRSVGASLMVEQACPGARARGVRPGVSLGQAQALVPELTALPYEPRYDQAALQRLADWALRFSPLVEPAAPGTLLVDITGCQRLFGNEESIARQALAGLARQGFAARAAIADTVGAAYAVASAGSQTIVVVPVGQVPAFLAPLPPAALRIDPRTSERLNALGVRSIGDLLVLPRASLPSRFGPQLVRRLQQALGEVFEGVIPYQPEAPPAAGLRFETPVADVPVIAATAERLLADVFGQVLRRGAALRRLDCVLYREHAPPQVISLALARACRDLTHVAQLLAQRLEQIDLGGMAASARPCDQPLSIYGLRLIARETSRWQGSQAELFEPRAPGNEEALANLIDRLAQRLGHAAIVRPRLVDDHQPEMAFRCVSVAEAGCAAAASGAAAANYAAEASYVAEEPDRHSERSEESSGHAPTPGFTAPAQPDSSLAARARNDASVRPPQMGIPQPVRWPPRPVRLLSRPAPIRVIALVPDGPPTWLACRRREYLVAHASGPERLETAWWRGPDVRRDYFRVTVESGEQFWIFRSSTERQWYLHGVFA